MSAPTASGLRSPKSRHLINSAVKTTLERLEERRLFAGANFNASDVARLEQGLDQVAVNFDQFGDNIRTVANNPLAIPLLIDRHNPKIPAIAPNIADLLTMKVDLNENGLIGSIIDPPDEATLNAIDTNNDHIVDLGEIITNKIVAPIKSFLGAGHTPAQLAAFINGLDIPVGFGDFVLSVSSANTSSAPAAPGSLGQVTTGQDSVSLNISLARNDTFELELGRKADTLGLKVDPNVTVPDADKMIDVNTGFTFNLNFGYETFKTAVDNPGTMDPTDFLVVDSTGPFFITDQAVDASVSMHKNNMNFAMRAGFLDLETVNAKVDLDALLDGDIHDPGSGGSAGLAGHITLSELQNTPLTTLFSIAPTGTLDADFPVKVVQLPGGVHFYNESEDLVTFKPEFNFNAANTWDIGIQPDGSPDVRTAPVVTNNATFTELLNFTNITPQGILGIINQFAGVLNKLRDSEMFKAKIPLAKDATLATVIDLVDGLNDSLLIEDNDNPAIAPVYKLIDKDGNPRFLTAQQLAQKLDEALGLLDLAGIATKYDPATDNLTYHVKFHNTFKEAEVPMAFDLDLGPVGEVSTSAKVKLSASGDLEFTFGVNLTTKNQVTLTTPLVDPQMLVALINPASGQAYTPANGRLTTDAVFQLTIGSKGSVQVTVPATDGNAPTPNNNIDDLIADVQKAINDALAALAVPINATVLVGKKGNRITMSAAGDFLRINIVNPGTNTAATQLGFSNGQLSSTVPTPANGILPGQAEFSIAVDGGSPVTVFLNPNLTNDSVDDLFAQLKTAINTALGSNVIDEVKNLGGAMAIISKTATFLRITAVNAVAKDDLGLQVGLISGKLTVTGSRNLLLTAANVKHFDFNGVPTGDVKFDVTFKRYDAAGNEISKTVTVNVLKDRTTDLSPLGFTNNQQFNGILTSTNTVIQGGRLPGDVRFKLTVGATTAEVLIKRSDTTTNTSRLDLVADLTTALNAAGFAGLVTAELIENKIRLTPATAGALIKVEQVSVKNDSNTADNAPAAGAPLDTAINNLIDDINRALASTFVDGQPLSNFIVAGRQVIPTDDEAKPDFKILLAERGGKTLTQLSVGNGTNLGDLGFNASQSADAVGPRGNGRLAANVDFFIALDGGQSTKVTVLKTDTDTNISIAQLIDDINNALANTDAPASLGGKMSKWVVAGVLGDKITFTSRKTDGTSLKVYSVSSGVDDVGFKNGVTAVAPKGGDVFFKDIIVGGDVNLDVINLDAEARFGFVGIKSTGGNAHLGVGVDFKLVDPNKPLADNGTFLLPDLYANASKFIKTLALSATKAAPADGKLASDLTFTLKVGNTSLPLATTDVNVTVLASATANNNNVNDLAGDIATAINAAFDAATITAEATVTQVNGKLTISIPTLTAQSVEITAANTAMNNLGFTAGQKSSTIIVQPTLDWTGSLVLGAVTPTPNFTGLTVSGGALMSFDFSNFETNPIPVADFSALEALKDFQKLDFSNLEAVLTSLGTFLNSFSNFPLLGEKIPVINQSVIDLLSFGGKFQEVVNSFKTNPTNVVQTLLERIKEAFGIPAADTDSVKLAYDSVNQKLDLDLDFKAMLTKQLMINMDIADLAAKAGLGGLADIINLKGSAALEATGIAQTKLSVDINLAGFNPADPLNNVILNLADSGIKFVLNINGHNLTFVGGFGPVGIFVNDGVAKINEGSGSTPSDGLEATLGLTDGDSNPGDNKVKLKDIGTVGITADLIGGVEAVLPVFFPTESNYLGDIKLTIGDLKALFNGDTSVVQFQVPDLGDLLSGNFSLLDNLRLAADGLDQVLASIQKLISGGEVFGAKLPLIGDQLKGAAGGTGAGGSGAGAGESGPAQFIQGFRDKVVQKVRDALDKSVQKTGQVIRQALWDILGTPGLDIVLDGPDGGTGVSIDDIVMTGDSIEFLQWDFKLGQTKPFNNAIDFDLGLPGLKLDATGNININFAWEFNFGFGISMDEGFYFVLNNDPTKPEIKATIDVTMPGGGLGGELAFLRLDIKDRPATPTMFHGEFVVDLINGSNSSDTKLSLDEITDIDIQEPNFTGQADVHLSLRASLFIPGQSVGVFPAVVSDFDLKWVFDKNNFLSGGDLQVAKFSHIGVDLGSFISEFLAPIANKIKSITEPFQPLVDVLTAPIPVISDLAGKPFTLIDLAGLFGEIDTGFIYSIADIISLINSIPDIDPNDNLIIYFDSIIGEINLVGQDLNSPGGLDNFNPSVPTFSHDGLNQLVDGLGGAGATPGQEKTKNFITKFINGTFGEQWGFPILQDPRQLVNILLGKDATLIYYDMAPLKFAFEYSQFFPVIGPLGASVTGSVGVTIDLAFGFDTKGIRRFADGGFKYPLDIFRGFFISDTNDPSGQGGTDVPEVKLDLGIAAAAELNLGIGKAGVGGGIYATINFDLNDPDGDNKVRIDEILNNLWLGFEQLGPLGPLGIFDVSGELTAKLFAFIEILFVIDEQIQIGPTIPLVDFKLSLERAPVLATDLGNGILRLNMGNYAKDRLHRNTTDGAEHFIVKSKGDHSVEITAFGTTQTYDGVNELRIEGGSEADIIDLSGITVSTIHAKIEGGAGDDTILLGKGQATVNGGNGNDSIGGGDGDDIIDGGQGDDTIKGGKGNDALTGGEGNDSIEGGDGSDSLYGLGGDDKLFGGLVGDYIDGGIGNDSIEGNEGDDTVEGGLGKDTIFGGADNDKLGGGGDADYIEGNAGADTIYGDSSFDESGTPVDPAPGTEGSDEIYGGGKLDSTGDLGDTIFGQRGNDLIHGNLGDDSVEGDLGADTIWGDAGNDNLKGQGDGDEMYGNGGNDTMTGEAGNDIMFGDDGEVIRNAGPDTDNLSPDIIRTLVGADDGDDRVDGGAANDSIFGGTGMDTLIGDIDPAAISGATPTGVDVIIGDYGQISLTSRRMTEIKTTDPSSGAKDILYGNNGDDYLLGGAGGDSIFGGHGPTNETTATDQDIIIGDNGHIVFGETLPNGSRIVTLIETQSSGIGGNDTIYGDEGSDTVLAGFGADSVIGDVGNDIALGDNGKVVLSGGIVTLIQSFDDQGGNDTMFGDAGADTFMGGAGNDSMFGDTGADVMLGDNGKITYTGGKITLVETTDTSALTGGNDTIQGDSENDTVLGGVGSDSLLGNTGNDVLIGDNGSLHYTVVGNDSILNLIETGDPSLGDHDKIFGNEGEDIAIGGAAGDSIFGNDANDLLIGDGAKLVYTDGVLTLIETIDTNVGGTDTIHGDAGNDTVFGGAAGDLIFGDTNADLLFGDNGKIDYVAQIARTIAPSHGATDSISGGTGNDTAFGGTAGDLIDGDADHDLLFGDHGLFHLTGDGKNPLVRVLFGSLIYDPAFASIYKAFITSQRQLNPAGSYINEIDLFDFSAEAPNAADYGNDTIAGGSENDSIFGQQGNDVIQGDSHTSETVNAINDPSVENATDGDDYIEGNAGNDLIFGNLGQDDIIGGSSDLFGLNTPAERLDGSDTIFGGAGTQILRNHLGNVSGNGHSRDADVILGDNGRIFRLIGANGVSIAQFLSYNYDNYPTLTRIIPRAVEMLDYTPGTGAVGDNGTGDLIKGESGDDSIHGMSGNDTVYGDGQDDDVIGGWGNDWISGGTGQDGVLGDDGKIYTTRNASTEPLTGLTTPTSAIFVSLPGDSFIATMNPTGALKKSVDLEPFDKGGNDTVYGGLGDDSLHGGAGNDAISGAEALDIPGSLFYSNPGSTPVLVYNDATGNFVLFPDQKPNTDSLKKINGFLLNFNELETDGNDAIFGDIGNDWLVGGRGSDHLYGGFGNDILDADDNKETNGALNDIPDPAPYAESDTAFGGGGRDTLLGNTGVDRLTDWVGEYNAYIVPFAPFGDNTVVRQILPKLPEFLIDLAESDGSDQTRTGPGLGTALRRGEPYGELGLVLQEDKDFWGAQTGAPDDPQAGNKPGGKKDQR